MKVRVRYIDGEDRLYVDVSKAYFHLPGNETSLLLEFENGCRAIINLTQVKYLEENNALDSTERAGETPLEDLEAREDSGYFNH